jgi:hypothetical protein
VLATITKPAGIEGPQPMSVATRITLTGDKISAMHRSGQAALATVTWKASWWA